ncbi:2OG-Fe(II) oxygenase family protein [Alphaproteobacteria bacterium]|nr:2OG-Fe(II) oxygenase family protein [Alphaproteobacteria bacterium]
MHLFFSSPIWASKIDNYEKINDSMFKYIMKLKENDPSGVTKSNFKGWHSKDFDLKNDEPKNFITGIKKNINFALNDMNWDLNKQSVSIKNLWAIINEKGAWNQKHHHSNSDLSAAYYVSAHENCGDIIFYDPRPAPVYKSPIAKSPNNLNATINSIKPEAGMLVLFPSYLEHSVNPNLSDKKRIVISFNINLEKN